MRSCFIWKEALLLLLILFVSLFNFAEKLADGFEVIVVISFTFALHIYVELISVLHLRGVTLSWFFVFLGKKALRMWKSVPYLRSRMPNSSTSSAVHTLDFSFISIDWLLEMESVSLQQLLIDFAFGFF